ncbi:MAG: response regulator [Bacteroidota bacterium]|nr:response regulator [Bacteroidota bacterium]
MNRLVASTVLQDYGASVIETTNGEEALFVLENNKIDLLLMDIQMPVMNGYEATKILRQRGSTIPIIALTANAIRGENEKCIEVGMNDYIAKPFKEDDFLKIIARWLNADITVSKEPVFSAAENKKVKESLYDLSSLHDISRGNQSFIDKMVNLFCEQTPGMIQQMQKAYQLNDLEKMAAIAHKIKPSIDNLKINSLKQIIRAIEKAGKERDDSNELPGLLQLTETVITKVINKLNQEKK